MGNCGSCFGDGEAASLSRRHVHRREHHQERVGGNLSEGTHDTKDPTIKRALVQSATEERIKQMENRGGSGALSKKLASQSKGTSVAKQMGTPPSADSGVELTSMPQVGGMGALPMAATVERVEETLMMAGFETKIPINRESFAGGDGNSVEDAPIGYYRFHFWKSDEQPKEHENWISNTDVTGPICVSFLREEQALGKRTFYRMLFRSIFATKSVVLCQDDVSEQFFDAKKLSKHQILGVGLREFINHEMDKMSALEDEFGAMSIRSSCSIASVSNDLVRALPSSRLREASMSSTSSPTGGLSRTLSLRSVNRSEIDQPPPPPTLALEKSGALRKRFRELCGVNTMELVKSFTQVREKEFCQVLLNLERALEPQVYHFDVVLAQRISDQSSSQELEPPQENCEILQKLRESSLNSFTKLLGTHLTKDAFQEQSIFLARQGRVPSDIMSELILEQRRQQQQQSQASKVQPASEESATLFTRRCNLLTDFVLNEVNYLKKLQLIDEYFLGPMDPAGQAPDPMGMRGLVHGEDYKFIFEGFPDIMCLHQRMLNQLMQQKGSGDALPQRHQVMRLVEEGIITGKLVAEVLLEVCKSKGFTIYANICDDFYERCQLLKRLCDGCPRLCEYIEHVAHDPRSNRLMIDQVMGSIFQMITRYSLQLRAIIESTVVDDESVPMLMEAIDKLEDTIAYIEHFKKRRDDTTSLFQVQRTINNCPPNLCQLRRVFLMKMAAYEAVKGEVDFGRRLALFLFNDILIGARKRKAKEGRLSDAFLGGGSSADSSSKRARTHDFMFLCPISGTLLKRLEAQVKARKSQVKVFSLEIPGDSMVWLCDRQVKLEDCSGKYPTSFLLVPKKQEKLLLFMEKFNNCKRQKYLTDSPADIFVRQWEGQDIYFHVYKQNQYTQWQHRNRVAILYCDQTPIPDLWRLFPEGQCDALMVVQVLNGAFRFVIRSREMIVASTDCFEPTRDFQTPEQLMRRFSIALTNCHLLYSIYPPFGPQTELQMRQQLEQHVEPFSRGIFRKFREITNKLQKTTEIRDQGDDTSSLYSVENNSIVGDDFEAMASKKKSVFGKVLGKFRSPLGK